MQRAADISQRALFDLPIVTGPQIMTASTGLTGWRALTGGMTTYAERRTPVERSLESLEETQKEKLPPKSLPTTGRITGPVRLIQQVQFSWSLTDGEVVTLLGYPSPRVAKGVLTGKFTFSGDSDREDRVRLIYDIHLTLSDVFIDAGDEERWMRAPSKFFENRSPLDYMLINRIPGMVAVRQFVEQQLANR